MEDENKTQPKLTLMEEVLLLGLKDKQVTSSTPPSFSISTLGKKRKRIAIVDLLLRSGGLLFCVMW